MRGDEAYSGYSSKVPDPVHRRAYQPWCGSGYTSGMVETGRSDSELPAGAATRLGNGRYSLRLSRETVDINSAQRLRHRVFAMEMGATVRGGSAGTDSDLFDEFCDHLLVRDDVSGELVGTYRMLPPCRARAVGGLYADGEFDLARLRPLLADLVEAGRSCVHPEHRNGAVVGLMWAGIARYMLVHGYRWLGGCASVPLRDGGRTAAGVWRNVRRRCYAPENRRVTPHERWAPDSAEHDERVRFPPLLRGYLRLGAWVCGPPAHDREFDVADFFVLLDTARMDHRYLERFLGSHG
nr:GNAT family N-acyltransferase [Actinopolyspora mortivallis]